MDNDERMLRAFDDARLNLANNAYDILHYAQRIIQIHAAQHQLDRKMAMLTDDMKAGCIEAKPIRIKVASK